jgi:hypothetical protein
MFMVGPSDPGGSSESVLTPIEGGKDREDQRIRLLRNGEQDSENVDALENVVGRSRCCGDGGRTTTVAKDLVPLRIGLPEHKEEVAIEEKKHREKIGLCEPDKLPRMKVEEAIVYERLDDSVPAMEQPLLVSRGFCGKGESIAMSIAPELTQSSTCVCGEGHLCVRVHGLVGPKTPGPKTLEIKPPGLPRFLEGKIRERMLSILGLACEEVFVIRKSGPPKDTRSRKTKSLTNQPSSHTSLDPANPRLSRSMDRDPEDRGFHPGMSATEGMVGKRSRETLIIGSPFAHRGTSVHSISCQEGFLKVGTMQSKRIYG